MQKYIISFHTIRFAYQSHNVNISINICYLCLLPTELSRNYLQMSFGFPAPRDVHILQLPHTHRHRFFHQQCCRLLHGQREVWRWTWALHGMSSLKLQPFSGRFLYVSFMSFTGDKRSANGLDPSSNFDVIGSIKTKHEKQKHLSCQKHMQLYMSRGYTMW